MKMLMQILQYDYTILPILQILPILPILPIFQILPILPILQDDYTANNFGQQETRDGYTAQGEYFVNLPDGRLQKVIFCHRNYF